MKVVCDSRDWLRQAKEELKDSEQPLLEAQMLLANILQKNRGWLLANPGYQLSQQQQQNALKLLQQRKRGVPLPYLMGEWEFFGLPFYVSPDVLIPRPETEMIVEEALAWSELRSGNLLAADVGTGSGCIAISIARQDPRIRLLATDISMGALSIARKNCIRHQVADRILLCQAHLLTPVKRPVDIICANLPYIPTNTLAKLEVRHHEPICALDGGPDGLKWIRMFIQNSIFWLAEEGLLLAEIEYRQGEQALMLAKQIYPSAKIEVKKDLAGHPRMLKIERKP